jgi:hypothetical protein
METHMKGYRTYLAAALVALFGALASTDWIAFLDDPKAGAVAIGSAVLMAVMRTFTTTPPGKISSLLR